LLKAVGSKLPITAEDRKVEQRVQAFHLGGQPPKTTHLIAEELPK
jgi:hypothetical protein